MLPCKTSARALLLAALAGALAGCATRATVDDGRPLDPRLVADMQAFGEAAALVRPAIVRSAAMADDACSHQYELPFDAMTTYGIDDDATRIAWLRALGVDDRLTVIAADRASGLRPGEAIAEVDGYRSEDKLALVERLRAARDDGLPFSLTLESGERLSVTPLSLCRGHVLVAPPLDPTLQRYHWSASIHPLQVFHPPLSPDEALWIVLWTQGLSEQGGARMKTYAFVVGGIKWISVLGLGFATNGAAATIAGSASGGQVAAVHLAGQAASLMARAAANRASLSGVSGVAAGVFDRADAWAFAAMRRLGRDPRAGLGLHEKLVAQGAAENAFLLDAERLARMRALVAGLPGAARTATVAAASPHGR